MKKQSASSQPAKLPRKSAKSTSAVRVKLDLSAPQALPTAMELRRLLKGTGRKIDTSDAAELDERFWASAVQNPYLRTTKEQVTVRVDKPVLEWLKRGGPGYQTRMNELLREAMLRELAGGPNARAREKAS